MSWQAGLIWICFGVIALWPASVLWNRWRNRFTRKLIPDELATRKRNIAAAGYKQSYNREWTL